MLYVLWILILSIDFDENRATYNTCKATRHSKDYESRDKGWLKASTQNSADGVDKVRKILDIVKHL